MRRGGSDFRPSPRRRHAATLRESAEPHDARPAHEGPNAMTQPRITPIPAGLGRGSVLAAIAQRGDDHYAALSARIDAQLRAPAAPPDHEGARSLHELLRRDDGRPGRPGMLARAFAPLVERTVADQVTSQNAGVNPPTWLSDVLGRYATATPAITAMGGPRPPDDAEGMSVSWPTRTDTNTAVGEQLSQKSAVASVRVDVGVGTAELRTWAGASDASAQLLQRSSPSYLDAYAAMLLDDHARVTDTAFAATLLAGGTAATAGWDADATGVSFVEALLAASSEVEAATGAPATVALCAPDVYNHHPRLSAVRDLATERGPAYLGIAGFGTLVRVPGLATGNVIVTNPRAACWISDGPFSMDAPNATFLGRDVGFFSLAVGAVLVPKGLRLLFGPGASGS